MERNNKNLVGREINGLLILRYFVEKRVNENKGRSYFEYKCVCGEIQVCRCEAIKSGITRSCGCKTKDLISESEMLPGNEATINTIEKWYKTNAKKRNLEWQLSRKDFENLIFGNCKYCEEIPQSRDIFISGRKRRKKTIASNGIDRVNNEKGYNIGNCVSCCQTCNRSKKDLTLEEWMSWINRIILVNSK